MLMSNAYRLKNLLTEEETQEFLNMAYKTVWKDYYLDENGQVWLRDGEQRTNYLGVALQVNRIIIKVAGKYGVNRISGSAFIKSRPNTQIDWHTDPLSRKSIFTIPLTPGVREFHTEEGVFNYDFPVVCNTRVEHKGVYKGESGEDSYVWQFSTSEEWDSLIPRLRQRDLIVD